MTDMTAGVNISVVETPADDSGLKYEVVIKRSGHARSAAIYVPAVDKKSAIALQMDIGHAMRRFGAVPVTAGPSNLT